MRRRRFLAGVGTVGAFPAMWFSGTRPRETLEVRYWLSGGAAEFSVSDRIQEYVAAALEPVFGPVEVTYGGVVPVQTEDGYRVTRNGEWPRHVLGGYSSPNGIDPAADVNLLVTDGSLTTPPTGLAMYNFASIGGARLLENLPPRDVVGDIVRYDRPFFAIQVLIHEVGHVLGLTHSHGAIDTPDGRTVASPMVSGYAWSDERDQFDHTHCACGTEYPATTDGERYLSLNFSECAVDELGEYRRRIPV